MDASEGDVQACCAVSYGHPLVRRLLGDSFHPGGLELTSRLADAMGLDSTSRVLDAGCGLGASAVHLARMVGCRVVGVTLEQEEVEAARHMAEHDAIGDRVAFHRGDIREAGFEAESFDAVLMECVLPLLPQKALVMDRIRGFLRPSGRLGLTDVTVKGPLPPELSGVAAQIGCVEGALSLEGYGSLVEAAGLEVEVSQDLPGIASEFLRGLKGKLQMAEVAVGLGFLSIDRVLLEKAKAVLAACQQAVRDGTLSYGLLVARRPG